MKEIERIHGVFHMYLLKQDTTQKEQVKENATQPEFDVGNEKKYNVKGIQDSAVYTRESKDDVPGLYYLLLWKDYSEEENT